MKRADRRVLAELQYVGPSTAAELGQSLDRTTRAVYLRLTLMEQQGLVVRRRQASGHVWSVANYEAGMQAYEEEAAAARAAVKRMRKQGSVWIAAMDGWIT